MSIQYLNDTYDTANNWKAARKVGQTVEEFEENLAWLVKNGWLTVSPFHRSTDPNGVVYLLSMPEGHDA